MRAALASEALSTVRVADPVLEDGAQAGIPGKLPQALVPHPCNDIFSPARVPAGPVAQRIEQRASNAKVAGSSPAGTATP
jgi:hypothetical protein